MSILNVNGKLTRIDTVAYGVTGDAVFTPGDVLDVDATIDEPSGSLAFLQWAAANNVSARIFVLKDELPAGVTIEQGQQVVANQEDEAAVTYLVVKSNLRKLDDLSHYEIFCKVA